MMVILTTMAALIHSLKHKNLILIIMFLTSLSLVLFSIAETANRENIIPPVAEVIPRIDTLHGDVRIDNYFWLRERDNPEVIAYLEAENEYTEAQMQHTEVFQKRLYNEILRRIKETDMSVPEKLDNYYYYTRTEKGKQYSIYCRKQGSLDAKEEILLDQNRLAKGYAYYDVGLFTISPNHELLAYSVDTTGFEVYTLYIKDLKTGRLLEDRLTNTAYSMAWADDNKTIFYTIFDDAKRPYKLYRHMLNSLQSEDVLVYHEEDPMMWINISRTKNKEYIVIELSSHITSEVHYLDSDQPEGTFTLFHPRQTGVEYHIEHHEDRFFILTNEDAENFRLMEVLVKEPSRENWKEIIPNRDSVMIDGFDVFKDHLVVYEREKGIQQIRIIELANNESYYVEFPEPVYTFWSTGNREFDTQLLRFTYTSLVTPRSVFDYDMHNRTRELKKQYEVLGGYNPSEYQSERIFARAQDGTMIPLSLVYKKGVVKDGSNPLYLIGYGAYGDSEDPYFSSIRLSLLERGFIYAIAHVRGGGEMGRYWYEQGKLLNKKNTFTDFIACIEYLIQEKYTSSDRLVITGGSAGGILIGAVMNMRPDLFKVVVAGVPFVDVLNSMLDSSFTRNVLEFEEWGNPREEEYYYYIKSYSPYDNVEAKDYPNILITAGLNDIRVTYWEAAKLTAKLRALKTDDNLLLLKTKMESGHLGASGRYDFYRDIAFEYAFILDVLGMKD